MKSNIISLKSTALDRNQFWIKVNSSPKNELWLQRLNFSILSDKSETFPFCRQKWKVSILYANEHILDRHVSL